MTSPAVWNNASAIIPLMPPMKNAAHHRPKTYMQRAEHVRLVEFSWLVQLYGPNRDNRRRFVVDQISSTERLLRHPLVMYRVCTERT